MTNKRKFNINDQAIMKKGIYLGDLVTIISIRYVPSSTRYDIPQYLVRMPDGNTRWCSPSNLMRLDDERYKPTEQAAASGTRKRFRSPGVGKGGGTIISLWSVYIKKERM